MSEETTKPAKRRWTPEDDATLTRLAALGAASIATALNRPQHQIRQRASHLGVSLRTSGQTRGRKGRFTDQQETADL